MQTTNSIKSNCDYGKSVRRKGIEDIGRLPGLDATASQALFNGTVAPHAALEKREYGEGWEHSLENRELCGGVATDRRVAAHPPHSHSQPTQPPYHSSPHSHSLFAAVRNSSVTANNNNNNQAAGSQSTNPDNNIINENEFPSLGARNTPSGGGFSPLATTSGGTAAQSPLPYKDSNHRANYATLMRNSDGALTNPEFTIQSEDFPALPANPIGGSQTPSQQPPQSQQGPGSATPNQLQANLISQAPQNLMTAASETFNAVSDAQGSRPGAEPLKGIITRPDGEVSNIPPPMLCDQFGMAGLLTYLRSVDNPPIVSLALGYDLTTLGLNLNLSEFYQFQTTPVHDIRRAVLSEDVLFYLFYNCPGEVYQLAAACELFQRDWRYHKGEGVWLTRSQYGQLKEQTGSYEKGNYNVFDQMQWRKPQIFYAILSLKMAVAFHFNANKFKIPKELKLEYKELEERPKLPTTFPNMNAGTGPGPNASVPVAGGVGPAPPGPGSGPAGLGPSGNIS
ncbi:hypothetical protein WR25_06316 [Diploscapter pachys]|uniref:NOT2/NOT3/NOT5 C-terminal domain-containing protein n=1 Tax=Diploscapter pachys TaxID=2018661 RepID=A0A2A2JPD4_9BILA|nr:hypothetical protein WR25_06316 [Diploscapter pachys]